MNNAPFYIGQKVVRIGCSCPPLVERGQVYTVSNLKQCPSCKNWKVSCAEFPKHSLKDNNCSCGDPCPTYGLFYGRSEAFAPIEENTYEDVTKELAVLPQDEVPDVKTIKELVN